MLLSHLVKKSVKAEKPQSGKSWLMTVLWTCFGRPPCGSNGTRSCCVAFPPSASISHIKSSQVWGKSSVHRYDQSHRWAFTEVSVHKSLFPSIGDVIFTASCRASPWALNRLWRKELAKKNPSPQNLRNLISEAGMVLSRCFFVSSCCGSACCCCRSMLSMLSFSLDKAWLPGRPVWWDIGFKALAVAWEWC